VFDVNGGWRSTFLQVFARADSPMALQDSERRTVAVNAAQVELCGYSREQLIGHKCDELLDPDERETVDAEWRVFAQDGFCAGTRTMRRSDGRRLDVDYTGTWTQLEDDSPIAVFTVLHAVLQALPAAIAASHRFGDQLTPRELQIVGLIGLGRRAHEIGDELGIATATVQTHIRAGIKKCGGRSQAQLVANTSAQGLLDISAPDGLAKPAGSASRA
jgi:PAS domain S-box-containing protein